MQALIRDIVERIDVMPDKVRIRLDADGLGRHLGTTLDAESPVLCITTPATLKRTGLAMRMVLESGEAANRRQPDVRLIAAIAKAQRWWRRLLEEPDLTVTDLARIESLAPSSVTRIIRLAFLDPTIVTHITEGRTPADLDLERLTQTNAIPASWQQQRQQLGFRTRRMTDRAG